MQNVQPPFPNVAGVHQIRATAKPSDQAVALIADLRAAVLAQAADPCVSKINIALPAPSERVARGAVKELQNQRTGFVVTLILPAKGTDDPCKVWVLEH